MSGEHTNSNLNNCVFLGFQLTEKQKEILKDVKDVRKKDQLKKFNVDLNRGIGITHKGEDIKTIMKYLKVTRLAKLSNLHSIPFLGAASHHFELHL